MAKDKNLKDEKIHIGFRKDAYQLALKSWQEKKELEDEILKELETDFPKKYKWDFDKLTECVLQYLTDNYAKEIKIPVKAEKLAELLDVDLDKYKKYEFQWNALKDVSKPTEESYLIHLNPDKEKIYFAMRRFFENVKELKQLDVLSGDVHLRKCFKYGATLNHYVLEIDTEYFRL